MEDVELPPEFSLTSKLIQDESLGGDDPKKAMDLVLKLVSAESDSVNGRFCWIDQPLQAPIPSWEEPVDARPWS